MKWEKKTIGEICNVISGGTPKRSRSDYWGGNIPWVKISDMLQGEIIKTSIESKVRSYLGYDN